MSLYRDPLAGLKSQVATKRGLVELRERELAPLMRAMLPAGLRKTIEDLGARALEARLHAGADADGRGVSAGADIERRDDHHGGTNDDSLEGLSAMDGVLDSLLAAYDEAIALVPKLRECPMDVADLVKPVVSPPWLIEEGRQRAFRAAFEARVREIAPEAYVVRWGDYTYLARLKVAGAPVIGATWGNFEIVTPTTVFGSLVRTSVHPSTPPLTVKVKTTIAGVAKALRLARDDETGDEAFDDAFMVDGRDGGVLLLSRDVTAAMCQLEPWGVGLVVKNGIAEVTWEATFRGVGFELLHDAAFAVALGIRAAIERA